MAVLTVKQRRGLSSHDFVFPEKAPGDGSYPIPDKAHAADALARSSGKPEAEAVRGEVCKRYPDMPSCQQ